MSTARCPLCKEPASELKPMKLILYHCGTCDLIFKDRALHLSADEERARYETHDNSLTNEGYVRMFEGFIESAVLPFVKPSARVLDYGSGPEPVLKALLERKGFAADAYDPFFAPDTHTKSPYDLITCTEALEHAFEPGEAWRKMLALLKEEGILAIMTHFHPGPSVTPGWWYVRDTTHVVFFSPQTFAWLAQAFGLSILYNDGVKTIVLKRNP